MSELPPLLPCPFCGDAASLESVDRYEPRWSAGCANEECFGFQSLTTFARRSEAINAWNKRALPTNPNAK